jgi:hypothetical protein
VALDQGCRFKGAIDMEPHGRPADVALPKREGRGDNANDRQQRTAPPPTAITS